MESNADERMLAYRMHAKTGKSIRTCLFCLKLARGNLQKAIEICSGESTASEDGRRS